MNGTPHNTQLNNTILPFPESGVDIKKLLQQLHRHVWIILAAALAAGVIAFLYTFMIQPKYFSAALIQFKSSSSENNMNDLMSLSGMKPGTESVIDAQVALIGTRFILEPVVLNNNLNIIISPRYFPIFGAWKARRYEEKGLAKPFLGLNHYAWGGENVAVKQFSVPEKYIGHKFKLVAGENDTYQLFSEQNELILSGHVGEKSVSSLISDLTLEVSTITARPGTEFSISYLSPMSIIKTLARNLKITMIKGNDPLQETGVEQVQLIASKPEIAEQSLNAIIHYTVDKNIQQKTQELQKTLEFLRQRLPEVKANLGQTENTINQYHSKEGTINMSIRGQLLMQQLIVTSQSLEKLKSQKEELLQMYTEQHPVIIGVQHKLAAMQKSLDNIKQQIKDFPSAQQVESDLTREAKIKNSMYLALLTNEQQILINKAGLIPDATILTEAAPAETMPSYKLFIIIMGFFMGAAIAIVSIIIRLAFSKTIESSEHLEDEMRIPVQSVIPYSRKQKQLEKLSQKVQVIGNVRPLPLLLAKREPDDIAIESLRSLRVSLHITASSTSKTIAFIGSLSNIGKSFVSLNFSQVMADSGKRTLLIDADLRKGRLHHALHQPKIPGLSEYLEEKCQYDGLIRCIHENLFYIPCGSYSTNPMQLFQSARFQDLIQRIKEEFDSIIIDTPPIIPVTDSVLIARHCDIKLFVVSAAKDTISDVKQAIKKANAHGITVNGFVLNHRKPFMPFGAQSTYRYAYGENRA